MRFRAVPVLFLLGAAAGDATGQNTAQARLEAEADRLENLAEAATDPDTALGQADARAIRIACDLGPRFLKEYEEGRRTLTPAQQRALSERIGAMRWQMLPRKGNCGNGRTIAFQPERFGEFLTAIAVSPGGREVAIRGGWQLAPLAGGGGECLFARVGAAWQRKGCIQTWVS